TLNTPENHNALSQALCEQLKSHVARANADDAVRMLVLTGVGRTFCAGADLKGRGGGAVDAGPEAEPPFVGAIRDLWNSPKPVIGRIQGNAYGGGLGLIATCDFAICVDSMRVAFTEVRLGVVPAIISIFVMRKMALADATAYFLSGDRMTAEEARQMKLVQQVVPEAELDAAVEARCESLMQCGPNALRECKGLLRTVPHLDLEAGLRWAQAKNLELFNGEEGREGMAAFAAKRKPAWVP
ncbi:MAG: enoyl-CoA hydratase, partial [Gammaproteobacteria bacterium]|nr:enoyl-CoA hydratase [Gammaproteobacteria bacterium]